MTTSILHIVFSPSAAGCVRPEEIVDNGVWDRAQPLDAAARERYHGHWRRLRAENAPLRVVDAEGLRSAPITFFDRAARLRQSLVAKTCADHRRDNGGVA